MTQERRDRGPYGDPHSTHLMATDPSELYKDQLEKLKEEEKEKVQKVDKEPKKV